MRRSFTTRLLAFLYLMVIGGAQIALAEDDTNTSVTVNAPTITSDGQDVTNKTIEYNGTVVPVITADDECSIVYVKSTSKLYTTTDAIDNNKGVKTEDSNKATIKDIIGKTGNRYISAYAVKDVDGVKYKSQVVNVTYTYNANATSKQNITLSASSISLDMKDATTTASLNVTATNADGNAVSGLSYTYEVYPEGIVTVDKNGVVTPVKAGTASITVIFAGDDKYNAATCVADVNVASTASENTLVFYNIADIRHAAQSHINSEGKLDKTLNDVAIIFGKTNPATVVAVMKKHDEEIPDKKFINSFFIVDNSNRGLWVSRNNIDSKITIDELAIGSKITGTLIGDYNEGERGMIYFGNLLYSKKLEEETYYTKIEIDHSGEAKGELPAIYPYTAVKDVNTISATNDDISEDSPESGDIVKSSYGVYLNTIVQVPGVIKKSGKEFYLVQDENAKFDDSNRKNRIFFNSSQIDINLDDYVNTSGTFEGILVKRKTSEPKLIVLKGDFYSIKQIYLDENDDENRINDLVEAGAFNEEADIYVHRTKLAYTADAWNTVCFPFDMTAEEFKNVFGCEITDLAEPIVTANTTVNGRLTQIGKVDANGNLLFTKKEDYNIEAGMPYLIKTSGTQTAGYTPNDFPYTNKEGVYTDSKGTTKTPQEIASETNDVFYAHIGQKLITVVPPHQIQGTFNNNVVNGDFYFRGLYGRKKYTEDAEGALTTTNLYDNGSQKYQYISTAAGNYLKYLGENQQNLQFPGLRAYFYFPNWKAENNKPANPQDYTNSKIHLMVDDGSTTGISSIEKSEPNDDTPIYNLAGQKVDHFYKGIVIKKGRKYLAK